MHFTCIRYEPGSNPAPKGAALSCFESFFNPMNMVIADLTECPIPLIPKL